VEQSGKRPGFSAALYAGSFIGADGSILEALKSVKTALYKAAEEKYTPCIFLGRKFCKKMSWE
jgi:hypothetical protein